MDDLLRGAIADLENVFCGQENTEELISRVREVIPIIFQIHFHLGGTHLRMPLRRKNAAQP